MSRLSLPILQRRIYDSLFSVQGMVMAGFWMFDAIKDYQNDTPEKCPGLVCRRLDGKVFRKTDLVARKLFPPAHDRCRCSAIEMDEIDVERDGLSVSDGKDFAP